MSTDIVDAIAALRTRAAAITAAPVYWRDEDDVVLPDDPAAFVWIEPTIERGVYIEIGGGRGANRYRQTGELAAYVFAPRAGGALAALALAEDVAAVFRSFRGGGVSCHGASVHPAGEGEALTPPGVRSVAGNYVCVTVAVPFHFDQIA
jgi:hypothetical protein